MTLIQYDVLSAFIDGPALEPEADEHVELTLYCRILAPRTPGGPPQLYIADWSGPALVRDDNESTP